MLPLPIERLELVADNERALTGLSRLRVLVVDDNHDAADSLRELLESWGRTPTPFTTVVRRSRPPRGCNRKLCCWTSVCPA